VASSSISVMAGFQEVARSISRARHTACCTRQTAAAAQQQGVELSCGFLGASLQTVHTTQPTTALLASMTHAAALHRRQHCNTHAHTQQ
jgi:hypothetical protein